MLWDNNYVFYHFSLSVTDSNKWHPHTVAVWLMRFTVTYLTIFNVKTQTGFEFDAKVANFSQYN